MSLLVTVQWTLRRATRREADDRFRFHPCAPPSPPARTARTVPDERPFRHRSEAATDERVGCLRRAPGRGLARRSRPFQRGSSYKDTLELHDGRKRATGEGSLERDVLRARGRGARRGEGRHHAVRGNGGPDSTRCCAEPRGLPPPPEARGPRDWPLRRSTRSGPQASRGTSGIPPPGCSPDPRSWHRR
jgi:hypothetical protein